MKPENHADIARFLEFIRSHHDQTEEKLEVRCIGDGRLYTRSFDAVIDAERAILNNIEKNVFIGVLGRVGGLRGDDNTGQRKIIWCDLDYGTEGHKHAEHATKEDALKALEVLPKPNCIVHTGGGIHAYWTLRKPAEKLDWDERIMGIINALKADRVVRNPERILRVPGTYNWKTGTPRNVELLHLDTSYSYNLDVFPIGIPEPKRLQQHGSLLDRINAAVKNEPCKSDKNPETKLDFCKLIPIADVVKWLNIPTFTEGRQVRAKCPCHSGATPNSLLIGGKDHNNVHCFSECGQMSAVDLVMKIHRKTMQEATLILFEQFCTDKKEQEQITVSENWPATIKRTKSDMVKPTEANIITILQNHKDWKSLIRFDEFTRQINVNGERIQDHHITEIMQWFQTSSDFPCEPTFGTVTRSVDLVARKNKVNSLSEYVQSIKHDGVPRLDRWLFNATGITDPLQNKLAATFLLGLTWRAIKPGSKMDYVLCLIGAQGLRKSTALSALVGHDRFGVLGDPSNKDAQIALAGKWLVEIEEGFMIKKTPEETKAFITRQTDDYRTPHAKNNETFPRMCCFALTTNHATVTNDWTGARRYWPLWISEHIDTSWIEDNREQLFAECMPLVRAGILPIVDETDELLGYQQTLIQTDIWVDLLTRQERNKISLSSAAKVCGLRGLEMGAATSDRLKKALSAAGFYPSPNDPLLWLRDPDNYNPELPEEIFSNATAPVSGRTYTQNNGQFTSESFDRITYGRW